MTMPELLLTPQPWQLTIQSGAFAIDTATLIQIGDAAGDETRHSADSLQSAVRDLADLELAIVSTSRPAAERAISLILVGRDSGVFQRELLGWSSPVELGAQGYSLNIDDHGVTIAANDEAGLFYGVQTLIQIARSTGRSWPALQIEDRPAVPNRGYLVDISRGKVHTPETLARLVRTVAHHKCNHLQLYTEHAFHFPSAPEIGGGTGALTPEDVRQLDEVCRENHVELAANFQSLGHQGRLLKLPAYEHLAETPWRFTFATDNDAVFELLDQLYGDLLPNFSSRLFNVNADEPWDLGRGVSKAMTAERGIGGVYLHHLRRLHELATKHGRRMAMWADVLKHRPELMPELPDDILLIDWWYEATERYVSLDALSTSGREFWICAATSSWMALYPRLENAIRNIRDYVRQGIAAGANGVLVSDWGDNGHDQLLSNSIYPFLWGAECAWSGGTTESADFDAAFGLQVLGDRSGAQVSALRRLGAAMQTEQNWMTTWNTAMALYEDPLIGKVWRVASPEVVAEARDAAEALQPLLSQVRDPRLRADLGFVANQVQFACNKVDTTRAISRALATLAEHERATQPGMRHLSQLIGALRRQREALPAMVAEFERRWLAHARPSSIQFNLDRFAGLIAQYDRAIAWLEGQRDAYFAGSGVDPTFSTYDSGGYAVLHEATYLWVKELEAIIGHDALPDDIKQYLRDVGQDVTASS